MIQNNDVQLGQPVMVQPQQFYQPQPQQQQNLGQQQQIIQGQQTGPTPIQANKLHLYQTPSSRLTEKMFCSQCQEINWTTTDYKNGKMTWGTAGGICLLGCVTSGIGLLCGLVPFCLSECKDVEHKCQRCNLVLGVKQIEIVNK